MIDIIRIKQQLIAKNMTVKELAELLNVNVNTVSKWLNGKHLDSINTFLDMMKILNLKIDDIKKG